MGNAASTTTGGTQTSVSGSTTDTSASTSGTTGGTAVTGTGVATSTATTDTSVTSSVTGTDGSGGAVTTDNSVTTDANTSASATGGGTNSVTSGGGSGGASTDTGTQSTTDGTPMNCASGVASTSTRPQLSESEATAYTKQTYFAQSGSISSPTNSPWDPGAGVGDPASFTPDFTVAGDGSGTHTTVQAAIDAASSGARRYILVKPGTYRETVTVPSSAPAITLYSTDSDPRRVVIVDNKSADSSGGTSASSVVTLKAQGFQVLNMTISNDFPTPSSGSGLQAVALHTSGDQIVLDNVQLHGFQDTLYLDSPNDATIARVYITRSFIEGDTDFIFGRATAVIENSTIHYLSSRKGSGSGINLAPSTHANYDFGYLIISSEFTHDASAPSNNIYLGRSWDSSSTTPTPNGQVVIRNSVIDGHIRAAAPWGAAATSGREYSAAGNRFYEYCNTGDGAGG